MITHSNMHKFHSWVTGASSICSLGLNPDQIMDQICKNISHFRSDHRYQELIGYPCAQIDTKQIGMENGPDINTDDLLFEISHLSLKYLIEETNIFDRYEPGEVGLFLGTTTMGIFASLQQFGMKSAKQKENFYLSPGMQQNTLLERLLDRHPIRGFSEIYSTACSSGAMAILQGHHAVQSGMLKACIAGGFDVLTPITLAGFSSLQVVSPVPAVPFSKHCQGITLSEGGGLILIEKDPVQNPLGRILGGASGSECWHLTQPEPDGLGMQRSINAALRNAYISHDQIDYINAHGTGTPANDKAEKSAIKNLFREQIPFHSSKRWHGHTLAGSGALEAVITLKFLQHPEWLSSVIPGATLTKKTGVALSNSFGFGGSNVTLVFGGC